MKRKTVTKEAKKLAGAISEDEFFEKLSAGAGYVDPVSAKNVYDSLKNLILSELKAKGVIELPGLCDIQLTLGKEKIIQNRFMASPQVKPAAHQVRMIPSAGMKQYFKVFDAFSAGKVLDPRKFLK